MVCKVSGKEQTKVQIIEWLDSGAVMEQIYYLTIGLKGIPLQKMLGSA